MQLQLRYASFNECNISSCEVFISMSSLLIVAKWDYWWLNSFSFSVDFIVAVRWTTVDHVPIVKVFTLRIGSQLLFKKKLIDKVEENIKKVTPEFN